MDSNDVHQGIGLSGQVAIVTGGGRGIGRAIALALAKDGMTVAVVAQTERSDCLCRARRKAHRSTHSPDRARRRGSRFRLRTHCNPAWLSSLRRAQGWHFPPAESNRSATGGRGHTGHDPVSSLSSFFGARRSTMTTKALHGLPSDQLYA